MAERPGRPDDDLEAKLLALRSSLDYPSGERLSRAVGDRLRAASRGEPARSARATAAWTTAAHSSRRRRSLALLVAALLLIAALAAAARLSIGAVTIREEPTPPRTLPTATETVGFGEPTTLARAEAELGASVLVPSLLGEPGAVYVDRVSAASVRATLAWRPSASLPRIGGLPWGGVLMEFRGDAALATKTLYGDARGTVEPVTVRGEDGYWLTGPHELDVVTAAGNRRFLVGGNVLLWRSGDLTMRLETALPKADALRIADSIS
jgi:hypothetical protein